jgi:paired amphipathic helix protein Sin3a
MDASTEPEEAGEEEQTVPMETNEPVTKEESMEDTPVVAEPNATTTGSDSGEEVDGSATKPSTGNDDSAAPAPLPASSEQQTEDPTTITEAVAPVAEITTPITTMDGPVTSTNGNGSSAPVAAHAASPPSSDDRFTATADSNNISIDKTPKFEQTLPTAGAPVASAVVPPPQTTAVSAAAPAPLPPTMAIHPPAQAPPRPPAAAPDTGMRELRVEDALLYLDDVKREFRNRPAVYNEFLTIIKNFKTQEVDTPGVIQRVSRLFRGYNRLILGFNTFLPEGYKISLADLERADAERERLARLAEQRGEPPPEDPGIVPRPPTQAATTTSTLLPQQAAMPVASPAPPPPPQPQPPVTAAAARSPPAVQQRAAPAQAVEFDHAISYVTTIKRRFANDPSTYHSFLEILHTYQKEQRGIKEVLEQVAVLFADHPDLLREFTFFLPDAVQDQAKERLNRAAADSESRLAKQYSMQQQAAAVAAQQQQQQQRGHPRVIDMTSRAALADGSLTRKRPLQGDYLPPGHAPETSFVYNSAVERQFFDAAREALSAYTRDGGQAWAEFMKCLDMYAQDILSRSEMLAFVEPLLGKKHSKLFEEFKRILKAAGATTGAAPPLEDAWYSVPLSEIDFSRCRRCSPSYRALPRDYPPPPCSDRNDEEAKVLNDIWVSLPVGSEESYTFRHMRRNMHEEVLFRVEDERFEIDMVLDSNAATLQRLLPIAEEIACLAKEEAVAADGVAKPVAEGAGMGGKRFQYSFDRKILGVIHRNSIARIYGDAGQEILDLMVKNPTVAIPLVVERLRQKDREWRKVRERLNMHWKDLAQRNYYKSLDHRGLTWRSVDKRLTSTRNMVTEIKDRALHGGQEGEEAIRQKIEKMKEEHGTFFEVTNVESLKQDLDLTFLPKPDRLLFTPHLSLMYENVSVAQRDAYRILAFALERGSISPHDKERCHRLWNEFLGPWFNLSLMWMQSPAVAYQEAAPTAPTTKVATPSGASSAPPSSDAEEESMEENVNVLEGMKVSNPTDLSTGDHHPLPSGTAVSTVYGPGKIIEFDSANSLYSVELDFGGKGSLRPSAVLCSVFPVEKSEYTDQLRAEDRSRLMRPADQLAIGTQSLFLFLRLHQLLVRRLSIAYNLAHSVGTDPTMVSMVEQMPDGNPETVGKSRYEAFIALVYSLLDGGMNGSEGGKYEDRIRSLLGNGAYELATIDKLISSIWKNLQSLAQDETMWNLVQLYRRHKDTGTFQPESFRQEAAYLSDHEAMYAFQLCPIPDKDEAVLHIEYLGIIAEDDDEDDDMEEETAESSEPEPPAPKRPKRSAS